MQIQLSKEYLLAHDIAKAVNVYGFNYENFMAGLVTCHRTNQQQIMRLMLETIRFMASEEDLTDDRNTRTHEIAKYIDFCLDGVNTFLPCI